MPPDEQEWTDTALKLTLPQAVEYAYLNDTVLQSAQEGAIRHIKTGGRYLLESTRTCAFYYLRDGKPCVAFSDSCKRDENAILRYAREGYSSHLKGPWIMTQNNPAVQKFVLNAVLSGRSVPVTDEQLVLTARGGKQETSFGSNQIAKALFGTVTDAYARLYFRKGYRDITIHLLDPELLKERLNSNMVELRAVYFGGAEDPEHPTKIDYISAKIPFYVPAAAIGVKNPKQFMP